LSTSSALVGFSLFDGRRWRLAITGFPVSRHLCKRRSPPWPLRCIILFPPSPLPAVLGVLVCAVKGLRGLVMDGIRLAGGLSRPGGLPSLPDGRVEPGVKLPFHRTIHALLLRVTFYFDVCVHAPVSLVSSPNRRGMVTVDGP